MNSFEHVYFFYITLAVITKVTTVSSRKAYVHISFEGTVNMGDFKTCLCY